MAEIKLKTESAKKKVVTSTKSDSVKLVFDPYKFVKYPLTTEKGVRLMESENKLLFVVDKSAKKSDIKKSVEQMFNVKVVSVNTYVTPGAEKRALVKFSEETPAIDVATQLGLI